MLVNPIKNSHTRNWLKLLLKIAVTGLCFWYISGKIDFQKAWLHIKSANLIFLFLAILAFVVSKFLAALRLNIYFKNIAIQLPAWQNIKLYWLGMFYNLFLPGSISGDAYKVILLKRKINAPYKKTTSAVLLDRFSGLLGNGLILAVYSIIVIKQELYVFGIIGAVLFAIALFYFVIHRWMNEFILSFFPTLLLGILVQASQVVCAYFIMAALGIPAHTPQYIFIFLVSSVVAVLPLTIGGLGAREIVFLEGSKQFGLAGEVSVVISMLFYLITLITSAGGIFYVFKSPLSEKNKDPLLSP
jgi:glycosyltransferase 2 family protein